MHRWLFIAVVLPLAPIGCGADATGSDESERSVDQDLRLAPIRGIDRTPFCLPGEKRVCTLGPPPVCHCEPEQVAPRRTLE